MNKKTEKIERMIFPSYIKMIENSTGSNLFRNFYIKKSGKKEDVMKDGELSCAFFVSSILLLFGLLDCMHGTVEGTVKDMQKNKWEEIDTLKKGCVIVWEKKDNNNDGDFHYHIGFFIGNNKAVSNSFTKKTPLCHHHTYDGKRKIERIFWNSALIDNA